MSIQVSSKKNTYKNQQISNTKSTLNADFNKLHFNKKNSTVNLKKIHDSRTVADKSNAIKKLITQKDKFCLVTVTRTKINTHINISNLFGNRYTLWTISGGQVKGILGRRSIKKTRYAQRIMYKATSEKLLGLGFRYFVLQLIGTLKASRYIVRALTQRKKRYKPGFKTKKKNKKKTKLRTSKTGSFNKPTQLKLIMVKQTSAIPHNGCRKPGLRRV